LYRNKTLVCFTGRQMDLFLDQDLLAIALVLCPCCSGGHFWTVIQVVEERREEEGSIGLNNYLCENNRGRLEEHDTCMTF
jgi:hypothetical protein